MKIRQAICGLCKPNKKWKRNNTRLRSILAHELFNEEITNNLIKSYTKISWS